MALEIDRFLKFNPFCGADPRCCNEIPETDYLSAAQFDTWLLPLSGSSSYDLYDCNHNLVIAGFGTQASVINSSFSFQVSGFCDGVSETSCEENPCDEQCNCEGVSKFRFCQLFRGEDDCTPTCTCSNVIEYTDETTFLDAIVTELSFYFDFVTRSNNIITVEWAQLVDFEDDPRCRSVLTAKTSFCSVDDGCCDFIGADCSLEAATLTFPSNRCTNYNFLEVMQLQGANLCIKIIDDKVCVDGTPMISFDFSAIACGSYYIKSDFGCSQIINVCDVCDTVVMSWRNNNEQLKTIRLKASISNLEFSKKQEISLSSNNTIRKLYSQMEYIWNLKVGEYRAGVHKDIAAALEADILVFQDYFEDSFLLQLKSFVHEDNYSVDWSDDFPRRKISTATTKIKESTTENLNNYC